MRERTPEETKIYLIMESFILIQWSSETASLSSRNTVGVEFHHRS